MIVRLRTVSFEKLVLLQYAQRSLRIRAILQGNIMLPAKQVWEWELCTRVTLEGSFVTRSQRTNGEENQCSSTKQNECLQDSNSQNGICN